eukprot:GHVU01119732.1.p1 GENE.GHVU01119732.1~~GHVU01119732.1.p1  ORF type:complete len:339 (+),score=69.97 GHVU01119732.1:629-1645(+)
MASTYAAAADAALLFSPQAFHADEVLAMAMLTALPRYRDAEIVRTRDQELLKEMTVVVDVGGEMNADTLRFDHHQRTFTETFDEAHQTTRMSSAGLVYKYLGKDLLCEVYNIPRDGDALDVVFTGVYETLIESVDALDNGVSMCAEPLYVIRSDLTSRVARLNPAWNEPQSPEATMAAFRKAIEVAKSELDAHVHNHYDNIYSARRIVAAAMDERMALHPSGEVICVSQNCPYLEHVIDLEKKQNIEGHIKFVIAPHPKDWRVRAVPVSMKQFGNRVDLPTRLRGAPDEKLAADRIPGLTFVHPGGFTGGAKTKEAALQLAVDALEERKAAATSAAPA